MRSNLWSTIQLSQNLICKLHDPKKGSSKDWIPGGSSADSKTDMDKNGQPTFMLLGSYEPLIGFLAQPCYAFHPPNCSCCPTWPHVR